LKRKLLISLSIAILISIILAQQIQIINLYNIIEKEDFTEQLLRTYLLKNYGVESIEELKHKILQDQKHYTGNPFTTALYQGQLQAENITGMHWYTYRGGSLLNRTDVIAYPEQTATFIIFKDSAGNVCAKNATSGKIQYGGAWDAGGVDGANDNAVVQAVSNALTNGGTIFFKSGTYSSLSISLLNNTKIIGEGVSTVIVGDGSLPIFTLSNVENVTISNLKIDANNLSSTSGAISLLTVNNIKIVNLYIANSAERAININGYCSEIWIENNIFDNHTNYGINANTGVQKVWIENNVFKNIISKRAINIGGSNFTINRNIIYNCRQGINVEGGKYNTVADNWIYNITGGSTSWGVQVTSSLSKVQHNTIITTQGAGIYVYGASSVLVEGDILVDNGYPAVDVLDSGNITVSLNIVDDCDTTAIRFRNSDGKVLDNTLIDFAGQGIRVDSDSDGGGLISGNTIIHSNSASNGINILGDNWLCIGNDVRRFTTSASKIYVGGSGVVVKYNLGFITEDSGTASGLADGGWIPHDLTGTPTVVTLTCLNSTYDGVPVIVSWDRANTNSTHIAVDIYWSNGTAITDNVIAISWTAEYQP